MTEPLFLEPVLKERIWGGRKLKDQFGYSILSSETGECWGVSAHPNGESMVKNGEYKGQKLSALWAEHPELFGHATGEVFPLLTKIIDARKDLSVQVHPDDAYAKKNDNGELGKTECWYVIDAEEDAEIILGHTAATREELCSRVDAGEWDALLRRVPVHAGDFFYVPSGTIHAIGAGILILETQQSSDTTYRVYDYDRTDKEGNRRELHLEKSLAVIEVLHQEETPEPIRLTVPGGEVTELVKAHYFSVYNYKITNQLAIDDLSPFRIVSVLSGEGTLTTNRRNYPLMQGDHLILPEGLEGVRFNGQLDMIVSHP